MGPKLEIFWDYEILIRLISWVKWPSITANIYYESKMSDRLIDLR